MAERLRFITIATTNARDFRVARPRQLNVTVDEAHGLVESRGLPAGRGATAVRLRSPQ